MSNVKLIDINSSTINSRRSFSKPVVLITGCGSGIGLALAILLSKTMLYRLVITSRKTSIHILHNELTENDQLIIREMDVTDKNSRDRVMQEVSHLWGGVNILINNAGFSYRAVVEHMSNEEEQRQFDTNYFGPVSLIKDVLPYMRSQGVGRIINVSSVSGMLAMPTMASYSASKYALEGHSESLWYEVKPLGISVCLIQPGFVRSKSFLKVRFSETSRPEHGTAGLYADYYKYMTPFIERLMALSFTTSESVAKKNYKVMLSKNPPLWVPVTLDAMFFYYLRRFMPRKILLPLLFLVLPKSRLWGKKHSLKEK